MTPQASWARRVLVRPIKRALFDAIRPLVVPDCDSNEDYVCVMCGEPVLRRFLTCSERCGKELESLQASEHP